MGAVGLSISRQAINSNYVLHIAQVTLKLDGWLLLKSNLALPKWGAATRIAELRVPNS